MITAPARLRVLKGKVTHIRRKISGKGTIQVRVGEEVRPDTVVAMAEKVGGYKVVHLADELHIEPKHALNCLRRKIGQKVAKGELLAEKVGLFGVGKKQLLASADSVVHAFDPVTGQLALKLFPHTETVLSGVYGLVDAIDHKKGELLIRSLTDVVYGIAGSGRERTGTLKILDISGSMLASSKQIAPDLFGQIVVGGSIIFHDAFKKAMTTGVAGWVTGGVDAEDMQAMAGGKLPIQPVKWADVGLSVLVTEGFGGLPIGQDIIDCLVPHQGELVVLDGNRHCLILPSRDARSMMYIRKFHLPVPTVPDNAPKPIMVSLEPHSHVRIVSGTHLGVQGMVQAIDQTPTRLQSGVMTTVITVQTDQGPLRVPYQNVEIVQG